MIKRAYSRLLTAPPQWARVLQIVSTILAIILKQWEAIPVDWKAAIPNETIKPFVLIFIVVACICQYPNAKQKV